MGSIIPKELRAVPDRPPATNTTVEIRKNRGGWGVKYQSYSRRPYAVFAYGDFLRSKSGAIRTFSTREGAGKAADEAVHAIGRPLIEVLAEDEKGPTGTPA